MSVRQIAGDVVFVCIMSAIPVQRQIQLQLFPAEEDALLYAKSPTYQSLSETGQRCVRAYLAALSATGCFPSQTRVAEISGLSRHAVQGQMADKASPAWAAVTELLCSCREDLAMRGSIAIPQIAWLILAQFVPGEGRTTRDTRTLTKVELDVLKTAAAMGGVSGLDSGPVLQVSAAAAAPDGSKAGVQVSLGEGSSLSDLVAKLRESQLVRQIPDSSTESGQSAGLAAVDPD